MKSRITSYLIPIFLLHAAGAQEPLISEFLADNDTVLADGDGDFSDWIEIYNPSGASVDLAGWHLTDSEEDLIRWTFPTGSAIPAGGYQLVFASSKSVAPAGELHASFSLSSGGEYLALVKPDGVTIVSEFSPSYPEQRQDVSYGPAPVNSALYFLTPTPEAANGTGISGFVGDTQFSHRRGFYEAAFDVTITTMEPGATIRYTLDGTEPTETHGSIFSTPIPINTTTVLRARAYKTGFLETDVDTQTYLFLDDVIDQPASISGWPRNTYDLGGSGTAQHDYEMDPAIVTDSAYSGSIIDALKAIPTVSLVTDRDDMFGGSGFYDSQDNESRTSIEIIYPDSPNESEQSDGGVEGHSHIRMKRSLRLNFRKELGAGNFESKLFDSMPWNPPSVDRHDTLILRGGNNRAWSRNWSQEKCTFCLDELSRQMQLATSGYGMRGSFVHLYINGLYWGMYNVVERADEHFTSRYFGGDPEDWYARNHGGSLSGSSSRFNYLTGTLKNKDMADSENYEELAEYLDIEGFIDYLLVQWLTATGDWPNNNWYAGNRTDSSPLGSSPTQFFTWDTEWSWDLPRGFSNPSYGPLVHPDFGETRTKSQGSSIPKVFNSAKDSPLFLRLLADRAYQHLANDGAMADDVMKARFTALTDTVRDPVIAESARWGDTLEGEGEPTFTRDVHWQNEVNSILNLMTGRGAQLLAALRDEGYYPSIDPSTFNQRGGNVASGFLLTLTNPNADGSIRYTLDGSDPVDGAALTYTGPITIQEAVQIRTRIEMGSEWSALNEAIFFVPDLLDLHISEIMYHPSPPSPSEATAGFTDQDDFEYLEIYNSGARSVELENMVFTAGITFTFPPYLLGVGERVIIASNPSAFVLRYGNSATVLGSFDPTRLANGGARIRLESSLGELISEITYHDAAPWPEAADGSGNSLVFVEGAGANPASAEFWRASALPGGTPGEENTTNFATWIAHHLPGASSQDLAATADPDVDGIPNLVEYAFELNPMVSDSEKLPKLETMDGEASLIFDKAIYKTGLTITPEASEDLQAWSQIGLTITSLVSPVGFERMKIALDLDRASLLYRFSVSE